jgi:hypothetical protein
MSDDQLYELARQRINRRNRHLFLLGADVLAFFVYIAAFAALGNAIPRGIGVFIAVAWIGLLAFHSLVVVTAQNRSDEIDREVARLRDALYEKPKRLELDEDGELIDPDESEQLSADKRREDSV